MTNGNTGNQAVGQARLFKGMGARGEGPGIRFPSPRREGGFIVSSVDFKTLVTMSSSFENQTDPARFYQDCPFPGKRMLAWSVRIALFVWLLPNLIFDMDQLPSGIKVLQIGLALPAIPLYFVGFWQAVVGKGYARILFLVSLMPVIGLLVIFFLPRVRTELTD